MRRTTRAGTSLIEILVVIVVFLVGVLALIQVFPPGLNLLRTTRNNTVAAQLSHAEMQRIQAQPGQLAEMVLPVQYVNTANGLRVLLRPNVLTSDLMPDKDPNPNPGRIDQQGNVIVGGQNVGNWMRVSGSNKFSRVIGETKPAPAPRRIPQGGNNFVFGGLLQLTFGPAYYFADPATNIGERGVLTVYGNDLQRRFGDRENGNSPNPFGTTREWEFFYVDGEDVDPDDVPLWQSDPNQDQLWIAPSQNREYRIQFSFAYNNQGRTEQYDLIVPVVLDPANPPTYATTIGKYWVISMSRLAGEPDLYGNPPQFDPLQYLQTERGSLRVQRVYRELPAAVAFDPADPYQFKVLGSGTDPASGLGFAVGALLINPAAFDFRIPTAAGRVPLQARVDYTVYDWRLVRDEFRVPPSAPYTVKLTLNSIKPASGDGPDRRPHPGIGIGVPDLGATQTIGRADFAVVDLDTGAFVLGNAPASNLNGWTADKTNGHLTFRDVDNDPSNGLSVYMAFPTGDPVNPWTNRTLVPDIRNRNVRALYMGVGEWSVQPFKAARSYRVAYGIGANGLGPGECLVGGTVTPGGFVLGDAYRLYFPLCDLNQKVVAGEVWVNDGFGPRLLADQEFEISGIQNILGIDVAYADVRGKAGAGAVFDFSQGYSVRRVRGASVKVRTLWNPGAFLLSTDQVANYNNFEEWARNWRRTENQSFPVGARN